jgi:sulfite reductase (NADPH) flavoprotein alpha-component
MAFARDQPWISYVQHKVWEQSAKVWKYINDLDAFVYVCGDATDMANSVDAALKMLATTQGGLQGEDAADWLADLKKNGRLKQDVF